MRNKDYKCRNGAWHDTKCCDTCWNGHPEAKPGEMFMGSKRHSEIVKDMWIEEAVFRGFSLSQAEFLFEKFA